MYQSKDMDSRADAIRFELKTELDEIETLLYREGLGEIDYDVSDGSVSAEVDWGPAARDPQRPGEYVEQPTCMMGILSFTVDFDHE